MHHKTDKLWHWVVRMMPKRLLYWSVIVAWARATAAYPDKTPDEITWVEACDVLS